MLRNKQGNQPKVSEILLYNPRDPQETFAAYWPGRPNHRPFSRLGGGRLLPSIQMQNSRAILQYKESRLEKGDAVNKGRVCNRMTLGKALKEKPSFWTLFHPVLDTHEVPFARAHV